MTSIRYAGATDLPALHDLINRAYHVERFFIGGDRISLDQLRGRLARGVFLVGESAGAAVATVYVEARGERGYFGLLAVDPRRQGGGWGRQMIAAAEDHCRRAGCLALDIHVVSLRTELPPFYGRLGYVETGELPFVDPRPHRPCHLIVMSKSLGN